MKIKKLLAIGLAILSIFVLSVNAFAMSTPTDITIRVQETDTHTYEAYQIFTGSVKDGKLENVKWGANANLPAGASVGDYASQSEVEALQAAIIDGENFANDKTELGTIETYVNFESTPVAAAISKDNAAFIEEGSGYYLIKDKNTVTGKDTYTQYIVKICENVTISRKAATSIPTIDKTANGANGTDASEGDTISYSIKVTVPDNILAYKAYKFVVTDTIDAGLTYTDEAPVLTYFASATATGTPVSLTKNTASVSAVTNGNTAEYFMDAAKGEFAICSGDIMGLADLGADSYFVITYKATLNADATNGAATPNENSATLMYNNNPNSSSMTTSNTATDTAPVYTYELVITEVNTDNDPIPGMKLKLQKKVDGSYVDVKEVVTGTDGKVSFDNIGSGEYKLIETEPPKGLSLTPHDPIEFTITDAFDDKGNLTNLGTDIDKKDTTVSNVKVNKDTGVIEATVANYASIALPVTGTIGIIVLGGAAIAACGTAIGMRIKSKKDEEED